MEFVENSDIEPSLDLTEELMMRFYDQYELIWDRPKRAELLKSSNHYQILSEGEFQGFFAYFDSNDFLYVCDLHVKPDAQRKGIGRSVITYLTEKARDLEVQKIKLSFFKSNSTADRFFRGLGFSNYEVGNIVYRVEKSTT